MMTQNRKVFNDALYPVGRLTDRGPEGISISIEDMRKSVNGTSNRGLLWTGVLASAPGKVKHLRPRSIWTPIEDLPR